MANAKEDAPVNLNVQVHVDKQDHRTVGVEAHQIGEMSYTMAALDMFQNMQLGSKFDNKFKQSGSQASSQDKQITTRLEQILNLQASSEEYMKEEKDDEAYGLLNKLYNLGPFVCIAPILMNYYVTLLKTERGEESEKILEQLTKITRDDIRSTPKECEMLGDKFRNGGHHYKALLFYQIAAGLLGVAEGAADILRCMQGCILGIKLSATAILEKSPSSRFWMDKHILPSMHLMRHQISSVRGGVDMKAICVTESVCLHHIETVERLVGDYKAREKTLLEQVQLMEKKLGQEEASKFQVYGGALNNLGASYLYHRKPNEAIDAFSKAIEAKMKAEDYETGDEKRADVEMSVTALSMAEEMKAEMETENA